MKDLVDEYLSARTDPGVTVVPGQNGLVAPTINVTAPRDPNAPVDETAAYLSDYQAPPKAPELQGNQIGVGGRVLHGALDPLNGGAQLLAHALPDSIVNGVNSATQYVNDLPVIGPITKALGMTPATAQGLDNEIRQGEAQYQADRKASGDTGIDVARAVGNFGSVLPLASFSLPARGLGLLGRIGASSAGGAAVSALNPVTDVQQKDSGNDFASQKLVQAMSGGLASGVLTPLVRSFGSAIKGVSDVPQKALADAGVTMTPGQLLGGGLARTEEKLTSVPLLGDLIKNAQRRGIDDFNRATYNETLAPIGESYSGAVGHEGVQAVKSLISNKYNDTLSKMHFDATDPGFNQDLSKIAQMATALPDAQRQTFSNILRTQLQGKVGPQGTIQGQELQGLQSEIRRAAKGLSGDASYDQRQLGSALNEVSSAIDNSLYRTNSPDLAQALQNANSSYARFARLRTAAGSQGAGNNGGIFTPAQLSNAVRSADKSVGKGDFATGNALMQDLANNGMSVLGSKYPDSGTAGRSMLGWLGGAATGAATMNPGTVIPALTAGAGATALAAAPYTVTGQRLAQALLMSRPAGAQAVGNAIGNVGGVSVPLLAPVVTQSLNNGK